MSRFNLSALAVRERAITLFLIVAIILSGTHAFLRLGRAEDPSFAIKTLTVTAVWPGATAQEMQDLVAEPLEKRIGVVKRRPLPKNAGEPLVGSDHGGWINGVHAA